MFYYFHKYLLVFIFFIKLPFFIWLYLGIIRILLAEELSTYCPEYNISLFLWKVRFNFPFHSSDDKNFSFSLMVTHACCNKALLFNLFKLGPKMLNHAIYYVAQVGITLSHDWTLSVLWPSNLLSGNMFWNVHSANLVRIRSIFSSRSLVSWKKVALKPSWGWYGCICQICLPSDYQHGKESGTQTPTSQIYSYGHKFDSSHICRKFGWLKHKYEINLLQ